MVDEEVLLFSPCLRPFNKRFKQIMGGGMIQNRRSLHQNSAVDGGKAHPLVLINPSNGLEIDIYQVARIASVAT